MRQIPAPRDPNALINGSTFDDAAVYRITDDVAVVQSLDLFTPVVDDPHQYGRIAAVNALSDLYAMGAEPRFCLSIVCFPRDRLPLEVLEAVRAVWPRDRALAVRISAAAPSGSMTGAAPG